MHTRVGDAAPPVDIIVPPNPSDEFTLGEFTRVNQPTTGTSLNSVTLQVNADIEVDGNAIGQRSFFSRRARSSF